MGLNISLPSTAVTELESYRWYSAAGTSLKNVVVSIFFNASWVDVSHWVKEISINGSVQNLSGEPGANSASIQLDNRDKTFSDLFATGPYYGYLNPGKKVKIELTVSGTTVSIFEGRVDERGFTESRAGTDGLAFIGVSDGSDWLEKKKFDKDYYYAGMKLVGTSVGNSILHLLLQTHGDISQASMIVTNGEVSIICPYTLFKEGESIQYRIRELARGCQPQYCGFRYDGKFIMYSRLKSGWSVPTSEYTLTANSFNIDVNKTLAPLLGNRVKVRGDIVDYTDTEIVLWELRSVMEVGKNHVFPNYCWETVATGNYFLCDPSSVPVKEYWARYEVPSGELIHVQSLAMSQKIYEGPSFNLNTTGTVLDSKERQGQLILQNSTAQSINVMNVQIKGKAAVRRRLADRTESDIVQLKLDKGLSDDDLSWGLVAMESNTSSIQAYGQTDMVISSEYIVDNSQIISILDWNMKYGKDPKHNFSISGLPFFAFVQPGAVMTFGLSDLGYSSLVEVSDFSHRITPEGSDTVLTLVETPTSWMVSSVASVQEVIAAPAAGTGGIGEGQAGAGTNLIYTVGSAGCLLPVDILCDGTDDQSEINSAINYIRDIGGGTVYLQGSTFNTTSAISLESNVELNLGHGVTISKGFDLGYIISALGTSSTHLSNIKVTGSGRLYAGIHYGSILCGEYTENFTIDGIEFDGGLITSYHIWINNYNEGLIIKNCLFHDYSVGNAVGCQSGGWSDTGALDFSNNIIRDIGISGIKLGNYHNTKVINNLFDTIGKYQRGNAIWVYGGKNEIMNNVIMNTASCAINIYTGVANRVVGNDSYDNGDMVLYGNCETVSIPETISDGYSLVNCTLSLSSTISAYRGIWSYLFRKTSLSTTSAAYYWLVDNSVASDMHTFSVLQGGYRFNSAIYIPSASGVTANQVALVARQYNGAAWVETLMSAVSTMDSWQLVSMDVTMLSNCVAFRYGITMFSTASTEYCYIDDISMVPLGVANEHSQQFYDGGTDTQVG